VIYSR